jgi:hypothetical protein
LLGRLNTALTVGLGFSPRALGQGLLAKGVLT